MAEEKKTTLEEAIRLWVAGVFLAYTAPEATVKQLREIAEKSFIAGAEWHREQMKALIEKWQEHAIRGMKVGNVSYFQGRVALCVELLENLKEAGK